jgi:hypothetical protein
MKTKSENINFVFKSEDYSKNGNSTFFNGPFYNYVISNQYSVTNIFSLKKDFKNLFIVEPLFNSSHFLDSIDADIVEFVKLNDVKLLISLLIDPIIQREVDYMNDKLKNLKIYEKTIIVTSTINVSAHNLYKFDFFIDEAIESHHSYFNNMTELGYVSKKIKESELNTFRNRKFLSMNRNVNKCHRYNLLLEYYNGDYESSYFSFLDKLDADLAKTFSIINLDKINEINKILPIEIDTHTVENKMGFRVDNTYKKEIFLDTCINIVTETSFIDNELFLSEKILKPILMYQPFIVLGPSKILSHLKSYGFKTFGEFWDEGYDDVEDFKQRLEIVLKLINKLNQKSIKELNELYQKTKEICIYNRRLFETLQLNSIPQIFKKIENEW